MEFEYATLVTVQTGCYHSSLTEQTSIFERKTLPVRLRDQKALAFLARREEPAFFDEDGVCSVSDSTHSLSELSLPCNRRNIQTRRYQMMKSSMTDGFSDHIFMSQSALILNSFSHGFGNTRVVNTASPSLTNISIELLSMNIRS